MDKVWEMGRLVRPAACSGGFPGMNRGFSGCLADLAIRQVRIAACGCSSMVESQPSKLAVRVRFPSPAPAGIPVVAPAPLLTKSRFGCVVAMWPRETRMMLLTLGRQHSLYAPLDRAVL